MRRDNNSRASPSATQLTENSFALSFLLLVLVSLAMTSFGFFVSTFLRKVRWPARALLVGGLARSG